MTARPAPQLDLFPAEAARPAAPVKTNIVSFPHNYRRTDPETSVAAGQRAQKFAGKQHARILDVMRAEGRPMSAEEIGDKIPDSDNVKIARRTSELLHAGKIEVVDHDYVNRSRSRARRYRLVNPFG